MGCLKYFSIVVAVVAILAYTTHKPLPSCFDDLPTATRFMLQAFPLIRAVGHSLELLGIATEIQVMQKLFEVGGRREPDTNTLTSVDSEFDGVPVRVYLPSKREPNGAALLYIHGGGWTFGTMDTMDKLVRVFAEQLNVVAVNVEYRLAPDSPYPAAVDDAEKALRYFAKHAGDYNIDASRIAIAGDSAGGNLAAALTIRLRNSPLKAKTANSKEAVVQPKLQILLYPLLQVANHSTVSILRFDGRYVFLRSEGIRTALLYALGNEYYNKTLRSLSEQYLEQACYRSKYQHVESIYLDEENNDIRQRILSDSDRAFLSTFSEDARSELLNPTCKITDKTILDELHSRLGRIFNADFSPLLSESVEGLPTAYIVTCGYDVIRDDGLLYVERLRDAGVRVEHSHQQNQCHGYYSILPERSIVPLRDFLSKTPLL